MTETWGNIYRMHNNNIKEVWNETQKGEYINSLTMQVNFPPLELRKHRYLCWGRVAPNFKTYEKSGNNK